MVEKLLIAEGPETALAAAQLTGLPAIASAGKGFFKDLDPPKAAEFILCADCGADGDAALLAQRLVGCVVRIAVPERPEDSKNGYDWNDALLDAGNDESALAKLGQAIVDAPVFEPDMSPPPLDEARLAELASLDPVSYDQQREEVAKLHKIRLSTLDKLVETRREEARIESQPGFLEPTEPWPDAVDGNALLGDLCTILDRHIVLPPEGGSLTCALWTLHAHAHDAARHSPILFITSPTKRCGKTNLLESLSRLVPKPLSAANVTPATIFRAIDRWHPTMLIDETDTFLSDKSDLRGVLNSGHTKSQAYVIRCVGDDLVPKQFSTWAPKAFAAIGRMHPTLEDRSIQIELKRKLKSETVERIPKDPDAYLDVLRRCVRWAQDHATELLQATPQLPDGLNDRARDNWEPLLAIAEACGGEWAKRAREAAVKLSGIEDDEEHGIVLLQDLRALFERKKE